MFNYLLMNLYNKQQVEATHRLYDQPFYKGDGLLPFAESMTSSPRLSKERKVQLINAVPDPHGLQFNVVITRHLFYPGWNRGFTGEGRICQTPYPYACAKVDLIRSKQLDPKLIWQAYQILKYEYRSDHRIIQLSEVQRAELAGRIGKFSAKHPLEYYYTKRVIEARKQVEREDFSTFFLYQLEDPVQKSIENKLYQSDAEYCRLVANQAPRIDISVKKFFLRNRYKDFHVYYRMFAILDRALLQDIKDPLLKKNGYWRFDTARREHVRRYERIQILKKVCQLALAIFAINLIAKNNPINLCRRLMSL
jgi:hypothetical protein